MNSEQADNASSAFDRELNEALVNTNIANGYEEFLALFDRFYAEQVEVASDGPAAALAGKSRVLPVLFNFLVPLHVMAEIGGLAVTLRYSTRSAVSLLHFGIPRFIATSAESNMPSGRSICSEFSEDALHCSGPRSGGGRTHMSSTSVITNIARSANR